MTGSINTLRITIPKIVNTLLIKLATNPWRTAPPRLLMGSAWGTLKPLIKPATSPAKIPANPPLIKAMAKPNTPPIKLLRMRVFMA